MNIENRIWQLLVKVDSNEATDDELQELNTLLLRKDAHLDEKIRGKLNVYWNKMNAADDIEINTSLHYKKIRNKIIRSTKQHKKQPLSELINFTTMLKHYLKSSWRNLIRNKSYGLINILGLTFGLAIVMLIALWIWDEVSYNKYFKNYDRIAMVLLQNTQNGQVSTNDNLSIPLSAAIRNTLGSDVENVTLLQNIKPVINYNDKKITALGVVMEPGGPAMLSLEMVHGSRDALKDPSSVLISQTLATSLFGDKDPMNQIVKITNQFNVKIGGVYKDLPKNTYYSDYAFIESWEFYQNNADWVKEQKDNWKYSLFRIQVQLAPHADINVSSRKIKNLVAQHVPKSADDGRDKNLMLFPMSRWHLHDNFDDRGMNTGGQIKYVELFGCIGLFILLLACINFMNLSTARSEKRAKEVGIRKAIGSSRKQIVAQFFSESIVAAFISFLLAVIIVSLALPWFNRLCNKDMKMLWFNGWFWLAGIGICLFTGIVAGSYPAIYLSSFKPIKVLKGIFKGSKTANIPRKVLVVFQFAISIFLIISTVIIYKQIQFAKDRPVGYNQNGLISVMMTTPEIYKAYNAIENDLMQKGAITGMAESQCPLTQIWAGDDGFEWQGKDPNAHIGFPVVTASLDFGKVAGWQFVDGRGYSRNFPSDSMGLVLTQSAVKRMQLKNPVGQIIKVHGIPYTVLGVVKDVMMDYPFGETPPVIFPLLKEQGNFIVLRVNPNRDLHEAMKTIAQTFQKYNPAAPFEYTFVDEDYAKNFAYEERIGSLSTIFSSLAIFISLLGLFGIASFMAEQRTKEIGIRKVLGASILTIWKLLSKDLMLLVSIGIVVAVPTAYFAMNKWLTNYNYRIKFSAWIFIMPALVSLLIALITISIQTLKAARANPVKSLKTE